MAPIGRRSRRSVNLRLVLNSASGEIFQSVFISRLNIGVEFVNGFHESDLIEHFHLDALIGRNNEETRIYVLQYTNEMRRAME